MTAALLDVQNLGLAYGKHRVVDDLSFTVGDAECVALVGSNGAGKSTTLRSIVGIHPKAHGRVVFAGDDVTDWSSGRAAQSGVVLCPEGRHLFPQMTVTDNLLVGAAVTKAKKPELRRLIGDVQELFPILAERQNQLAGTLSGGEQQMVALGRALMAKPRLLILDEPSLGLAPLIVEKMFDTIETIRATGCSILIAEQNVEATLDVADRAYVVEAGDIVASGTSTELKAHEGLIAAFMGMDVGDD